MGSLSLLGTGGTISASARHDGTLTPARGSAEILEAAEGVQSVGPVTSRDVLSLSSRAVGPHEMFTIAAAVQAEVKSGATGVVITHGTDTLEETAFALSLLLNLHVPVVLTGAMRPPDSAGSDAAANVRAALVAASDPRMAAYGPVVAIHDELHLARWVTKVHTSRLNAFTSGSAGPIGVIVEDRVRLHHPAPSSLALSRTAAPSGRVELLWVAAGMDGLVVNRIADALSGLVVAGTGGGHVPPLLATALTQLVRRGCPVVLASRCGQGPVLTHSYGGAGSETQLLSAGLVAAGDLSPVKSRLRLLFGLSAALDPAELFPVPAEGTEGALARVGP